MPARVPGLPPNAPRTANPLGRWFGRAVLALGGWHMRGEWPDLPKMVIIAAPHSTGWDAVWGLAAKLALGVRVSFLAKHELFWWPLGPLLRALGGIPTDRSGPRGVVGGVVQAFQQAERLWLAIAPEGTRRRVEKWKSGFWHIASGAGVPVTCVYFHYPERVIGIGPAFDTTGDLAADMARIREFYRPWQGKHRGTV